ncbi:MAG: lactate racemase domain-containing protein [Bacteroidales bacterium]|nr:lactate racemase domain-containing protein [Bacteroidales bacterium]
MSRVLDLKYGSREISVRLNREITRLSHQEPPVSCSPDSFRELLSTHLPLKHNSVSSAGIVVADKTRLCQYPGYLPVLSSCLLDAGLSPSRITFYIAYGTHPPQSDAECLESYGQTYRQFRFVHHHSRDTENFESLGTTSRGTSVRISGELLRHDLLISFGAILHHYFAGYGGGRKLLFPGLAAYESILENHRLFVDFQNRSLAAGCRPGELDHNPLALDLEEINGMLPPRLEIHAILNSRKQVCELHAGKNYKDFREVCRKYDQYFRSAEKGNFDLVIASAGGYPKDINFIQAHKSIHHAASFVKKGGTLIVFAECRDGTGNPELMDLFRWGDRQTIFDRLSVSYENNAGTALSMLEKSERIDIRMLTLLGEKEVRLMGAKKSTPEEVQAIVDSESGSVALLENAGMLYR